VWRASIVCYAEDEQARVKLGRFVTAYIHTGNSQASVHMALDGLLELMTVLDEVPNDAADIANKENEAADQFCIIIFGDVLNAVSEADKLEHLKDADGITEILPSGSDVEDSDVPESGIYEIYYPWKCTTGEWGRVPSKAELRQLWPIVCLAIENTRFNGGFIEANQEILFAAIAARGTLDLDSDKIVAGLQVIMWMKVGAFAYRDAERRKNQRHRGVFVRKNGDYYRSPYAMRSLLN
jgi:hypothetical protein